MDFATFEKIARNNNPEDGVFARFYDRVVKCGEIDEHGMPKFESVCFVEIRIKDNNSEVFDQPATDEKIQRFPAEYARYQLAKKQVEKGTPLEQFAFLTLSEIESLKVRGIFTVEALSSLSDSKAEQLELKKERDLAVYFMEQARDNQVLIKWQKKEEKYREQISILKNKTEALKMEVRALKAKLKGV